MKATLVVLAVTATGFAAAATYVHRQLSVERVRTQDEVALSNRLEQRVRDLASHEVGVFRAAEVVSAPQVTVLTAVRQPDGPGLEPRQQPSAQFREDQPDTARMSLRLIRERIPESGSR